MFHLNMWIAAAADSKLSYEPTTDTEEVELYREFLFDTCTINRMLFDKIRECKLLIGLDAEFLQFRASRNDIVVSENVVLNKAPIDIDHKIESFLRNVGSVLPASYGSAYMVDTDAIDNKKCITTEDGFRACKSRG